MIDPTPNAEPPSETPVAPIAPEVLAARLAARLCHDFMSPASGIVSGLDLLDDPAAKDMRAEAMALIASSARKLIHILSFYRLAFGTVGAAEMFDTRELQSLATAMFAHVRPELDWAVSGDQLDGIAGQALLNMVQIGAGCLAAGGLARVAVKHEAPWTAVIVDATGPRARIWPEVLAGLRGQGPGEGLSGRWVQARFLHALVTAAGGAIAAEASDGAVSLKAILPAADLTPHRAG
jgi:histidine phosphotransferase ChpT